MGELRERVEVMFSMAGSFAVPPTRRQGKQHQEKPNSRIRDKLVLRVIKTTYGAVLMENAEILHTSIPRGMYAEIDTVQHTANALRDGNGAYRSSEWCALQGWKSSRACPQSSGGCRSLQLRLDVRSTLSVTVSSSSIITYCTLSLSLSLGSATCVRLWTPVSTSAKPTFTVLRAR